MKFKAIIFDLDGTIIDTEHAWRRATDELIESRGIVLSEPEKQKLHVMFNGYALKRCCEILKEQFQLNESIDALAHEKRERAHQLIEQEVQFIQGFHQFHSLIKSSNIPHAIATNADDFTISTLKRSAQLESYFGQHIYGISSVNHIYKPNPDIYLYAAKQLNIRPEDCLAIEDSAHGIAAAKKAGMFCIGMNSSKNLDYIKESDHKVNNYDEIELHNL